MSQKRSRREYEADLRRQQAPFVFYGTPLPLLDEDTRDDGSYVPVWKQEVTDERGRKRLHGAFTGGFSAGYFNSVGSKEGWTPSTFVSSRSSRAKDMKDVQQQKVEDFMDDEDLREREESRQISTVDGFAGFGDQNDQATHHALDDLFKPVQDSMGEKLLNKMGWKKGQGIGPRVRRKIDSNDEASEVKEFPPEDSPMLELSQKHDTKGLNVADINDVPGPQAAAKIPEDEIHHSSNLINALSQAKKSTRTSGIGIGTLNDTGSDDEDPYNMGPKMLYNRALGGGKKAKKSKPSTTNANPLVKTKPVFISKKLPTILNTFRKCHDGRLPLTGFVLAEADELDTFGAMSLSDEKYKPPEVPQDWQPSRHNSTSQPIAQNVSASMDQTTTPVQHQTAQSRANILQEARLPSKSVFDFLSPAARDRLVAASGKTNLPPALSEAPPVPKDPNQVRSMSEIPHLEYPALDPTTALTALTRLRKDKDKPYADDLQKQGRYKDYLRFSSDPKPITERIPPLRAPAHKADEDHLSEMNEFATTANLFRPATGFFASRFTSAASAVPATETGKDPTEEDSNEPDVEDLLRKPAEKPKDPAEEAARMGMFGVATRSTIGFFPTKLLCKRFGVDMPTGENM